MPGRKDGGKEFFAFESLKCLTFGPWYDKLFKPHGMGSLSAPRAAPSQRDLLKEVTNMYAVIKTGGKQYSVKVGDVVYVEKLNAEADTEVTFDQVLAVGEEGSVKVGAPVVDGASVVAKVVKNGKGKKLNILTYRPKKGSMVRKGHRQPYTKVEITAING